MSRAERRRQERKVKVRWLRRLLRFRFLGADLNDWARKYAPRFAHHHGCDCGMCADLEQYLRHRDVKDARREAQRVIRDGGDE